MKRKISTIALIFVLACSMLMSDTLVVSAASKKIAKPFDIVGTSFTKSSDNPGKISLYAYSKNAKKMEIYKATSSKGKFKKVYTMKNGKEKKIKAPSSITFYKFRGVNGKKKSKFGRVIATYATNVDIVSSNIDYSKDALLVKVTVDNSTGANDMIFDSQKLYARLRCDLTLDKSEIKYAYEEDGEYFDENDEYINTEVCVYLNGKLVDEQGNPIDKVIVNKNTTADLYLKYTVEYDSETQEYQDNPLKYAKRVLDRFINSDINDELEMLMFDLSFQIKSGSKLYKLFANISSGCYGITTDYKNF